ncbi:hypothetical protein ACA910_017818 [Epithemia clementina (nom. ined.)]
MSKGRWSAFRSGIKTLVTSVVVGAGCIVMEPIMGIYQPGVQGLFRGLVKGVSQAGTLIFLGVVVGLYQMAFGLVKGILLLKEYDEDNQDKNNNNNNNNHQVLEHGAPELPRPPDIRVPEQQTVEGDERRIVRQVLDIFSTASHQDVQRLVRRHRGNVEIVVNELLTIPATAPQTNRAIGYEDNPMVVEGNAQEGVKTLHRQRKVWSYDFMAVANSATNDNGDGDDDDNNNPVVSASFRPTEPYLQQAEAQLFHEFPFLSHFGAKHILRNMDAHSGRRHYAIAHHVILQAIQTKREGASIQKQNNSKNTRKKGGLVLRILQTIFSNGGAEHRSNETRVQKQQLDPNEAQQEDDQDLLAKQYRLVKGALAGQRLSEWQEANLSHLAPKSTGQPVVKHPRKPSELSSLRSHCSDNDQQYHLVDDMDKLAPDHGVVVTDAILLEEMEYVRQKVQDWLDMASNHIQRKHNQEKAQSTNTGVECMCCFDNFLIEDMCACRDEGHLFCVDCLQGFADSQIFGLGHLGAADKETKQPAMELLCFHADCQSGFSRDILEKALPRATLEKYDELQFQIAVQAAALTNLVTCPKCEFQVQVDSNPEAQRQFTCPMDDCKFESCRLCRLPWHSKEMTCDDARQKAYAQRGRHGIEEAMSMAKIRSCPTCHKAFLKETGCNKIQCTGCQTLICYVCRQVISKEENYRHFCQTPHCTHETCGKCRLWTKNDDQEDETAMRQAGLNAAAAMDEAPTVVDQLLKQ